MDPNALAEQIPPQAWLNFGLGLVALFLFAGVVAIQLKIYVWSINRIMSVHREERATDRKQADANHDEVREWIRNLRPQRGIE